MLERQSPQLLQTQNTPGETSKENRTGRGWEREKKIQIPSESDSSEKCMRASSALGWGTLSPEG